MSLSVPETLTCDVVLSCPRVRLSGAGRDARPAHLLQVPDSSSPRKEAVAQ